MTEQCDECGQHKSDVECVGGAMWCRACEAELAARPLPDDAAVVAYLQERDGA